MAGSTLSAALCGLAGVSSLLVAFLFSLSVPQPAAAEDRIWSALVLATNAKSPAAPSSELKKVAGKLEKFFGYNQVQLVGSATKTMDDSHERWLVPSQNFWVCVKAKKAEKAEKDRYLLNVTLFHDRRRLVETDAQIAKGSPLFIRGPLHARGQLVIVLEVLD